MIPRGYEIVKTTDRVGFGMPEFRTRFRRRAERRCHSLNSRPLIESFRYEVVQEGGRYAVVAFQNELRKLKPNRKGG